MTDADGPEAEPDATSPTRPAGMPMFPLGTVLLPGSVLPLQIFEPRYRAMIRDCLAGDQCFGVVLIARGHEVGGGDERTDVGTVARVVRAAELPNGMWQLLAVGTDRLRVRQWLPDDPYPRAETEPWEDDPTAEPLDPHRYAALLDDVRRVLALAAEVGEPAAPATTEFADDPALGTFQIAAALPLGPFDRQRVLATDRVTARADLLARECAERAGDLEGLLRLGGDDGPGPHSLP
jgi:Lon protease-like protein